MRGFVIVLDSFGVGAAPDAAKFGDEGASTIKTIYKSKYFSAENMKKMGLLAIDGIDLDGKEVVLEGTGIMGRMLQHECDHLDGHVYLDRLEKEERRAAMKYMREHQK